MVLTIKPGASCSAKISRENRKYSIYTLHWFWTINAVSFQVGMVALAGVGLV